MSEPYFGSPEEAASELGAPLLVAASAASALPRVGRRLSEYAVENILGAHLFHRLRLASPLIPQVIWVVGPHGTLEHIGWAVGIAEHAAAAGRMAYLALLDGVQPLQGFATGSGLILPPAIVSRMAGFGVANVAGWVSDLQGVRLVFPTPGSPGGDAPIDPFRWILIVARALPEGIETTQRYRTAADGVIFAAAIRDHHREELLEASRALHAPGAPLLGIITMGPVTAGALPIIERWERLLARPEESVPQEPPRVEEPPRAEAPPRVEAPPEPPVPAEPAVTTEPTRPAMPSESVKPPEPAGPTRPGEPPVEGREGEPRPLSESPRREEGRPPAPRAESRPPVSAPVSPAPPPPRVLPPKGTEKGTDRGERISHPRPATIPRLPSPPSPPRRSAPSVIVAGLGEGVRPREEPVPLVASWLPSGRRARGRRIVAWIVGVLVVAAGAYLLRGEIARLMPQKSAIPSPSAESPSESPQPETLEGPADSSASGLSDLSAVPPAESMGGKTDSVSLFLPIVPSGGIDSGGIDSMRAMREGSTSTRRRDGRSISILPQDWGESPEPQPGPGPPPIIPPAQEDRPGGSALFMGTDSTSIRVSPGTQRPGSVAAAESITAVPTGAWPDTFIIHVSSYQQPAQAAGEVERLRGLGIKARIASVVLPARGMWYRVIVGAFPDSMAAWREATRLREIGYIAFAQILRSGERKRTP